GTVRNRLRSQALGSEAGGTRRKKREEASHRCDREKAGGAAASPVGEWRSIRTVAQPRPSSGGSRRLSQKDNNKIKTVPGENGQKPKPSCGDCVNRLAQVRRQTAEPQGANQIAAPAETRTPNMHRAK